MLIAARGLYKIMRWRPKCSQASGDNMSTSCLLQCRPSSSLLLYCSLIRAHLTTKKENLILTEPILQACMPGGKGGGGFLGHGEPQLCSSISVFMHHGHRKAALSFSLPLSLSKRPNIKQLSPVTFLPLCFGGQTEKSRLRVLTFHRKQSGQKINKKIRRWIKIEYEQPSAIRSPRPSQCIFMLKGGSTLLIFSPFCTGFLYLGGDLTNHTFVAFQHGQRV